MSQSSDSIGFDDLPEFETENDSTDDEWIDLEAGDVITGEITAYHPFRSYNGVVEIDGRPLQLNKSMARAICNALVQGGSIGIRVGTEEQKFTNEDGEEITYFDKEIRAMPPEDDD